MSLQAPPDEAARVADLVRRAEASRQSRRAANEQQRAWYERGVGEGPRARYNKLQAHLDRVASYLFSPDTVRFGVHLPADSRDPWLPAAAIARDEFRERWHDSGAGLVCASAIEWALVYGATAVKVQHDPALGFQLGYIQPWDLAVLQEDKPVLDGQHAICHWYALSIPEVEAWLAGDPEKDRLVDLAQQHATSSGAATQTGGRQGLVVTNISGIFPGGTISGGFPGEPDVMGEVMGPVVDEPVVLFVDVWERRLFRRRALLRPRSNGEVYEDWLVTTMFADSRDLFLQRRNPELPWTRIGQGDALPGEQPFVAIRPRPLPDYFWGRSELAGLRLLQQWNEQHLDDIKRVEQRRLNPANYFSGVTDYEEAGRAMSTPGGAYGSSEPTSKMEPLLPPLGEEAFTILARIGQAFNDASGLPDVTQGEAPQGVRATGQLTTLAGIGAGRILRMALVIEDPLGSIATKAFHLLQRHDQHRYPLPEEQGAFLLSQLPAGLTLRVNAHSHAPIFAEQTMAKAMALQRAGALEAEDLVDLLDMPNREELKVKARALAKRKGELTEKMLEIQAERGRGGRPKLK